MSQRRPREQRSRFVDGDDAPTPQHNADTTIRFKLVWKHPGAADSTAITESYDKITADPAQWCRDIIKWYNDGLRPGEQAREFIRCEVEGVVPTAEHKWVKKTAMTQDNNRGRVYDGMICDRCGITGKRFNLNSHVKIDSKFKLKVYQRCDTSCVERKVKLQQPGEGNATD